MMHVSVPQVLPSWHRVGTAAVQQGQPHMAEREYLGTLCVCAQQRCIARLGVSSSWIWRKHRDDSLERSLLEALLFLSVFSERVVELQQRVQSADPVILTISCST